MVVKILAPSLDDQNASGEHLQFAISKKSSWFNIGKSTINSPWEKNKTKCYINVTVRYWQWHSDVFIDLSSPLFWPPSRSQSHSRPTVGSQDLARIMEEFLEPRLGRSTGSSPEWGVLFLGGFPGTMELEMTFIIYNIYIYPFSWECHFIPIFFDIFHDGWNMLKPPSSYFWSVAINPMG